MTAHSTFLFPIDNLTNKFSVQIGDGALFPDPAVATFYFLFSNNSGAREVVTATGKNGADSFFITRTNPLFWNAGDAVSFAGYVNTSTLAFSDPVIRPDSSLGSPGDGWIDVHGSDWQVLGEQLQSVFTSGQGAQFFCLRPIGEVIQNGGGDQAVVGYVIGDINGAAGGHNAPQIVVRASGSGAAACCYMFQVSFITKNAIIFKMVNNVVTSLIQGPWSITGPIQAVPFVLWIGAKSTDATHTVLTAKLYALTDLVNPLISLTVTDTTAQMQIIGQPGVTHSVSQAFDIVETWNYANDPTLHPLPTGTNASFVYTVNDLVDFE